VLSAIGDSESQEPVRRQLETRGDTPQWINLSELEFGPCVGCGGCSKTGRCVLKDGFTTVVSDIATCDRVVLMTPIFLGVHHPLMKKAVDRFLPLAGERFAVRSGEMHHRPRVDRPFSMVGIGVQPPDGPEEDGAAFLRLIARHAINMGCPSHAGVIAGAEGEFEAAFADALERTERAR